VLADDERICSANSAVFGRPAVTDVISCAYAPAPGRAGRCAEIVVNCDRARSSRFPGRELALYIAHGCDHLAGATDDTPARRKRMLRREQGWRRAATRAGITLRLFAAE